MTTPPVTEEEKAIVLRMKYRSLIVSDDDERFEYLCFAKDQRDQFIKDFHALVKIAEHGIQHAPRAMTDEEIVAVIAEGIRNAGVQYDPRGDHYFFAETAVKSLRASGAIVARVG